MIASTTPFISFGFDTSSLYLILNYKILGGLFLLILIVYLIKLLINRTLLSNFEIDQAEFGLGAGKILLRPNIKDQQIAYAIWVELSTRKIGLPIDLEHDVIPEIYDSWYNFFAVTRELIKDIPVSSVKKNSTQKIIDLSIRVLNEGLRPHLTFWQARFRYWYDRELLKAGQEIDPQTLQAKYPRYPELKKDLLIVNKYLIKYREKMKELIHGLPDKD